MALAAYTRFRFLWGAVDWQSGTDNPYADAQTGNLGDSIVSAGGVGVRRAVLTLDRTTLEAGLDPATIHFDWLNMTSGSPDDTWTTADYTTLETAMDAWFTTVKVYVHTGIRLTTYNWYRVGIGAPVPNPAIRQVVKGTAIAGTYASTPNPPQVASSVTFRTAVRRSWGRTYLPFSSNSSLTAAGRLSSGTVDNIAGATNTMVSTGASNDFYLVVYSKHLSAALNVEKVECDDVTDIIRRRR